MEFDDLKAEIVKKLSQISNELDENGREYEKKITALADNREYSSSSERTIQVLESIIDDDSESESVQFSAFVMLNVYMRHRSKALELQDINKHYSEKFKDHPTYDRCVLICENELGIPSNPSLVIQRARALVNKQKDSAGSLHLFANIVCTIAERKLYEVSDALLEEAMTRCDEAIILDGSYPKFHATKARLLMLSAKWDAALSELTIAMDSENPENSSYSLRISEYQRIQSTALYEKLNQQLAETSQREMQQISDQSAHSVELVGFFASVVALVVSSVEIATGFDFFGAACLMLVLAGVLVSSYGALSIALNSHSTDSRAFKTRSVIVGLGLILALGGVIIGAIA